MSVSHFYSSQDAGGTTHIYHLRFSVSFVFLTQHCYLPYCVKSPRSVQEPAENRRLTAYDQACFLTVATLKTIYEGFFKRRSVTNTANFFHSSSNWGKRRKTREGWGRGGSKRERGRDRERERERERAVNSINLCILIHIPATSLISVSPAPF